MPTSRPEARGMELLGYLGSAPAQVLAVDGDLAFVGLGIELAVIDVSDTSRPRRLDYLVLGGPVLDIAVADDVVYVAAGDNAGLYIIDASSPADLAVLNNLYAFSPLRGVAVSGDYAFVSTDQLHVLEIADPASPVEVATHQHPQDFTAAGKVAAVQGGHVYTLYRDYVKRAGGFRVVDCNTCHDCLPARSSHADTSCFCFGRSSFSNCAGGDGHGCQRVSSTGSSYGYAAEGCGY